MPAARTCPACGAHNAFSADRCVQCGYDFVSEIEQDLVRTATAVEQAPVLAVVQPPDSVSERRCAACGASNAATAKFCNQCGAPLPMVAVVDLPVMPPPVVAVPAPRRWPAQTPWVVGVALLLVVALFAIDRTSRSTGPAIPFVDAQEAQAAAPAAPPTAAPAVPASLQAEADSLAALVAATSDPNLKVAKQMELVELWARNGQYGAAAQVQQAVAAQTNSASAWANAGSLLYDYLLGLPADQQTPVAQEAVRAFQRSLEIEDNPNVRVNLALTYQFDPSNPMGTVLELQQALEADPDHPEANFNMGIMRARIGRFDQAITSMEAVIASTPANSEIHQRAEAELADYRAQVAAP